MNVYDNSASRVLELDQNSFGFVRAGVEHSDHGITNIYDTLALLPDPKELERVAHEAHFGAEALKIILTASSAKLPRSSWMQSLLDRYYAERIVNHRPSVFRITCLNQLILSEWLEIHSRDSDLPEGAISYGAGEGMHFVERVRQTLESRMFQQVRLEEIANCLSVSVSTLQRKFKDGAGTTIVMYLKKRRLEEGAKLLLGGKYNVAEVSDLVGYADPSSFSKAFKQEYGVSPADYPP
jgi:AraC-like DNA-binding protein